VGELVHMYVISYKVKWEIRALKNSYEIFLALDSVIRSSIAAISNKCGNNIESLVNSAFFLEFSNS